MIKKCVLFMITTALVFAGCIAAETKQENPSREVSAEKRTSKSGLPVEEWKESNVSYEDMPVEFQDTVVEAVLRDKIGKTEGEVYISELQKVHAISINGEQPHNLNDLSYCYNLQRLTFSDINIPSLEPIAVLPQLEELSFSVGTNVTEQVLEEIGKLPVLKNIHIGTGEFTNWGKLTDGSFLLPLADQLTELCAMGNIAWNPEVLAQMTKLETLKIENAEDISF